MAPKGVRSAGRASAGARRSAATGRTRSRAESDESRQSVDAEDDDNDESISGGAGRRGKRASRRSAAESDESWHSSDEDDDASAGNMCSGFSGSSSSGSVGSDVSEALSATASEPSKLARSPRASAARSLGNGPHRRAPKPARNAAGSPAGTPQSRSQSGSRAASACANRSLTHAGSSGGGGGSAMQRRSRARRVISDEEDAGDGGHVSGGHAGVAAAGAGSTRRLRPRCERVGEARSQPNSIGHGEGGNDGDKAGEATGSEGGDEMNDSDYKEGRVVEEERAAEKQQSSVKKAAKAAAAAAEEQDGRESRITSGRDRAVTRGTPRARALRIVDDEGSEQEQSAVRRGSSAATAVAERPPMQSVSRGGRVSAPLRRTRARRVIGDDDSSDSADGEPRAPDVAGAETGTTTRRLRARRGASSTAAAGRRDSDGRPEGLPGGSSDMSDDGKDEDSWVAALDDDDDDDYEVTTEEEEEEEEEEDEDEDEDDGDAKVEGLGTRRSSSRRATAAAKRASRGSPAELARRSRKQAAVVDDSDDGSESDGGSSGGLDDVTRGGGRRTAPHAFGARRAAREARQPRSRRQGPSPSSGSGERRHARSTYRTGASGSAASHRRRGRRVISDEEDGKVGGGAAAAKKRRVDRFDDDDAAEEAEESLDAERTAYEEDEEDAEDMRWVEHQDPPATDEITGEDLSARHVKWRSPDGSSTLRFNLSTLRKIAARAGNWRMPPHFRSAMDEAMRAQIRRKFGTNSLRPVWTYGGVSRTEAQGADHFFDQLGAWQARRLSDVQNMYVCPVCLLWLRTESDGSDGAPLDRESVDEAEEGDRESRDDDDGTKPPEGMSALPPCDPISVLMESVHVKDFCERTALRVESAAAQCCFRKVSQLKAHLRECHCLEQRTINYVKEQLTQYMIRTGDGLVHKWVHAQYHGGLKSRSANALDTQQYWANFPGMYTDAEWFSRAGMYLALYDEVEEQTSEASFAADDVLFGDRLFAGRTGRRSRSAARPFGSASDAVALRLTTRAWEELGFGGIEDEEEALDAFVADSEEDEGEGLSTQHAYLRMKLGQEKSSDAGDSGEEASLRDAADVVESDDDGDAHELDSDSGAAIEYATIPDALDRAEAALKKKRRRRPGDDSATGEPSSSGKRRGRHGSDVGVPGLQTASKRRAVLIDDDDETYEGGTDSDEDKKVDGSTLRAPRSARMVRIADDDD